MPLYIPNVLVIIALILTVMFLVKAGSPVILLGIAIVLICAALLAFGTLFHKQPPQQ